MNAKNPKFAIAPKGEYTDITPNKKYEILKWDDSEYFYIFDDTAYTLFCSTKMCAHLNFKNWILRNK